MKLLLHVVRGVPDRGEEMAVPGGHRFHRWPEYIHTENLSQDRGDNIVKQGSFFLIGKEDVETALQAFAQNNPGCEVRVYDCLRIGQCPAGQFVSKEVSKDGVLPT